MLTPRDFVEAHLYESEEDVIHDALRHLLRGRPELRVRLAVHRYQTEGLSLAKAAGVAGVSWAHMRDILLEHGVQPRLGPETVEEAQIEVQAQPEHRSRNRCSGCRRKRRARPSVLLARRYEPC